METFYLNCIKTLVEKKVSNLAAMEAELTLHGNFVSELWPSGKCLLLNNLCGCVL